MIYVGCVGGWGQGFPIMNDCFFFLLCDLIFLPSYRNTSAQPHKFVMIMKIKMKLAHMRHQEKYCWPLSEKKMLWEQK